jgi:cellulose synthase/poly-beta-1,6-N-acetylglucosamine synthase-like glycosyltransferase
VVVPFKNALHFLRITAPALAAAASRYPSSDLVFVDNGSTDGSPDLLRNLSLRVLAAPDVTISAVRNFGAQHSVGDVLAFVDADCLVPVDYLQRIDRALQDPAIDCCGARYRLPENPSRVEFVWHHLHETEDRAVEARYVPGGNCIVRRRAFEAIRGFRESVVTGEDADLGLRLREQGYVLRYTPEVYVEHLGNPKSLKSFFGKQRWHALGMFATVRRGAIDKPVAMTILHLGLILLGSTTAVLDGVTGAAAAMLLPWLVPLLSVAYRVRWGGRVGSYPLHALLLYQVYFLARVAALLAIARADLRAIRAYIRRHKRPR